MTFLKCILTSTIGMSLLAVSTPSFADKTLYEKLGGRTVLETITKDMLEMSLKDPRISHTFSESNIDRLEKLLVEHLCHLTNGPCEYTGQTMVRAHNGLGIRSKHFHAMTENLQTAMDKSDIPFRTQNKLLALLAPMHDDIVEKPED